MREVQHGCFEHAKSIAEIFSQAAKYGASTLADTWFSTVAFDSSRVMLYYLSSVVGIGDEHKAAIWKETAWHLEANLYVLKLMVPMYAMAQPLVSSPDNCKTSETPDSTIV